MRCNWAIPKSQAICQETVPKVEGQVASTDPVGLQTRLALDCGFPCHHQRVSQASMSWCAGLAPGRKGGVVFMNLIYQSLKDFYWITCQDALSPGRREHHQIPSLLCLE